MGMGRVGLDGGMVTDTPQRSAWKQNGLLLRASFTAPDATALGSYTPEVGNKFIVPNGGTWTIQSNAAKKTGGGGGQHYAVSPLGAADYAIGGPLTVGASPNDGFVVRSTGLDTDGYFLIINFGVWKMYEFDGAGGSVERATAAGTIASATGQLVVSAVGATIVAYWNGVQVLSYGGATRNQTTGTYAGPRSGGAPPDTSAFNDIVGWRAGAVAVPSGVV